ncbi:MAG: hypothetical protein ACLFPS_05785 [Clostridia bacterium]
MKRILMSLMLCLVLISFVNAESSGGILKGKQFDCIQLPQECADCSYVKITTITKPDLTQESIQASMTKDSSSFNYTYCNTEQIGNYQYCTIGDVSGTDTVVCKDFSITPSGYNWSVGFYIVILILSIGIIVLGYWTQDAWIVMLGSFGLVLVGLFVLFYGIADVKDNVYTWGIGIITLMLGAYFGIKASLEKLDL